MKPIPKIIYRVEWSGDVVTLMETKPESVPGRDGCLSVCEYIVFKFQQPQGCGRTLDVGQYWGFCGETDMGQSAPALCTECGGAYRLKPQ